MGNIKHMMLKRELSLVLHFCKVGRHRKKKNMLTIKAADAKIPLSMSVAVAVKRINENCDEYLSQFLVLL